MSTVCRKIEMTSKPCEGCCSLFRLDSRGGSSDDFASMVRRHGKHCVSMSEEFHFQFSHDLMK